MSKLSMEIGEIGRPPAATVAPGDPRALAMTPMFAGVDPAAVAHAIARGQLTRHSVPRDVFLPQVATGAGPAIVVLSGQIAVAAFAADDHARRWTDQARRARLSTEERDEESLLEPPPLARVARKNLALFLAHDVFHDVVSAGAMTTPGQPLVIAAFTAAPTEYVAIDQGLVADWAARMPGFEARFRRALFASRERLAGVTGVKQELLDFFVRQGISVAGEMVRVRQLELCIDCKQCEDACEERYGARRLTLGGYQLGMLDFVYTCRTCADQRCVDPCAYDSIRFDPIKREVVINEASCTGCTACAQACPYGAIDMVEVDDPAAPTFREDFKVRLDGKGALKFGPGTPRVARARRIANKCDHCGDYRDQACVSACPTGSLIEVDATHLFRERSVENAAAAASGWNQDVKSKRREVLPVHGFIEGLGVRSGGLAKIRRGRWMPRMLWGVGLVVFALALLEVGLRKWAPTLSYQWSQLRPSAAFEGLDDAIVLEKIRYRAGDELSAWAGLIGTGLMLIAAIYPVFRRVRMFRWIASNTMWFEFHMMAGTVGPLFVALHSALQLGTWVSAAFWSMMIVVVSGVIGRYLYTQVPALTAGVEVEDLDHQKAFAQARRTTPVAVTELDRLLTSHSERCRAIAQTPSLLGAMAFLFREDLAGPGRRWAMRGRLRRGGVDKATRRDLVRRANRLMKIHRGQVVGPKAELLLHAWKKVHVPFTVLLTIFTAIHVAISFNNAFPDWF